MMPGLTLQTFGGDDIADVSRRAQKIADSAEQAVGFEFNSVRCVAQPGGNADKLVELYSEAQQLERVIYSNETKVSLERKWDR